MCSALISFDCRLNNGRRAIAAAVRGAAKESGAEVLECGVADVMIVDLEGAFGLGKGINGVKVVVVPLDPEEEIGARFLADLLPDRFYSVPIIGHTEEPRNLVDFLRDLFGMFDQRGGGICWLIFGSHLHIKCSTTD